MGYLDPIDLRVKGAGGGPGILYFLKRDYVCPGALQDSSKLTEIPRLTGSAARPSLLSEVLHIPGRDPKVSGIRASVGYSSGQTNGKHD